MAALHARCFQRPWPADVFTQMLSQPLYAALGIVGGTNEALRSVAPREPGPVAGAEAGCWASTLMALVVLLRAGPDDVEILTLCVDPAHRRRGLGRQLLTAAGAWAVAGGARQLLLEVHADNTAGLALYRRWGLTEIGRRAGYYTDPPGDALVLARML